MKKSHIVTCMLVGFMLLINNIIKADELLDENKIIGRWELCLPDGRINEKPNVRQKIYTEDSYVVLEIDKNDNTTYIDFVGKISYDGDDKITETVIYTDSRIKHMLSKSFRFFYKIDGQYLYLKGIGNMFNEIWIKISD